MSQGYRALNWLTDDHRDQTHEFVLKTPKQGPSTDEEVNLTKIDT